MRMSLSLVLTGWGICLGAGSLVAQEAELPSSVEQATFLHKKCSTAGCANNSCPVGPVKIIVHQQPPKVVFEDAEPRCRLKNWRLKRESAVAGGATVAQVLSPLSLGVADSQMVTHTSSLDAGLSELHALHQMSVHAANLKAARETREAVYKAQEAYTRQIHSHLSSLTGPVKSPAGVRELAPQPESLTGGNADLSGKVVDLQNRMKALEDKVQLISVKCQEIADGLKKK